MTAIKCSDCGTIINVFGCCDCYDRLADKEINRKIVDNVDKCCICDDDAQKADLKGDLFCKQCFEDVYL